MLLQDFKAIGLERPRAKQTDVCIDDVGPVACWHDEATDFVELLRLTWDLQPRPGYELVRRKVAPGNAYPRVCWWGGSLCWAWREDRVGWLLNLTTANVTLLGELHGNAPLCFAPSLGLVVYQATAAYDIVTRVLGSPAAAFPTGQNGLPDGLSHVDGNRAVPMAEVFRGVPGMVNPQRAGGCVVGENTSGIDRDVARLDDGREIAGGLWPGLLSFTPRIAADPAGDRWVVGTAGLRAGQGGARVAVVTRADFSEPVIVLPPEPPIPPPPPVELVWPDTTFVVDPKGRIQDTFPAIAASTQAVLRHDGVLDVYYPKEDGKAGEHWRLTGDRAWHQFDRRYANDPGWWLERGAWFARTIWTGLEERFVDVMHDERDKLTRPFIYTLRYEVAVDGRWRVRFDNRDERPNAEGRRPGRAEDFTYLGRWIRWTELIDKAETPGDVLERVWDDKAQHFRDYLLPGPGPAAYLPPPRPASAPAQPPVVDDWPPHATIVEPRDWPQSIPAGGTLRCVAAMEDGSGAIERFRWYAGGVLLANNDAGDVDHTFRDLDAGSYDIVLECVGPGGVGRTTRPRTLIVEQAEEPGPEPGESGEPEAVEGVVTALETGHGEYISVRGDTKVDGTGEAANDAEQIEFVEVS